MKFTDIFIQRPILAIVLSSLILLVGARALTDMPVAHIGAYAHRAAYLDKFRAPRP